MAVKERGGDLMYFVFPWCLLLLDRGKQRGGGREGSRKMQGYFHWERLESRVSRAYEMRGAR